MEESKDKELEGVNVRESIVSVKTVVTTTETVIKTVVEGGEVEESRDRVGVSENKDMVEEVDGGACEVGDVMVEVLGCDVFVDGVTRVGELGRGDVVFGDDGDGGGVDLTSCRKENVGSDGLRRDFRDSGARDVDKERTVERVVEKISERKFGYGEVADNGTELSEDSSFRGADIKSNDIESNAPYPMTTTDSIPSIAAEQMVGTTAASFEIVDGEDRPEEADEQVDTEANAHGHGLVSEDKTVDGGIKSVEASTMEDHRQFLDSVQCSSNLRFVGPEIPNSGLPTQAAETDVSCETGQEKPVVRDSENASPEPSDMQTQVTTREFMDFADESMTVLEPDMGMTGKLIQERLSFVNDENFNESALAAGAGRENGALDEMNHVGTDMEIDAARGSEIHSESQLVDTKERAKGADNTLSKDSGEETWVVGMDIDAVDAGFGNEGFVCEVPHDELKSSSENHESKGVFLVKCKTGMAISDESTKLSDSIELASVDKSYMGVEATMQNIDENLNEGSSVSEADAHHISIAGNFVADLHTGFGQDGTHLEDDADQRPVLDDSSAVKGAIQVVECRSDASRSGCIDNPTADGVAQIGLAVEDNQKVQNAVPSERAPVDNVLAYGTETELLTDGVALMGSNTKIVQEGPDEQANIGSPSINENKIIMSDSVVASMDDVAQVGLNMEVAEELHKEAVLSYQVVLEDTSGVNDEPTMLSDVVISATGAFVQNGSNVEEIEEVQEEAASAEGVVYLNNAAPAEEETPKQSNPGPFAVEDSIDDTQGGTHMVDENLIEGPFIVETEDPAEFVAGNAYVDVESDPTRDDNVGSDADVDNQVPPFQSDPLVTGFEHEPADHDVSADLEMEDAQDEQEEACSAEQADSPEELEAVEEHVSGSAKPRNREAKNSKRAYSKSESLSSDYRVTYQLPPEFEGEFSVFDLVWGKVKSHPWWPGQIFHPSDSSEKAMKYFRKDCYFVAYFGDRTFAWNEASVLKPFRKHFSVAVRQNKTEAFQNAVSCALAEVSRRTELGLACSCISEEAYDKIRYQMVENTGVREKSSKRDGVDRCTGLDYFKPDKLVEYVRSLAVVPTSGVDRLELVIAKAQLLAFSRLQGTDTLAEYRYYEGISSQVEQEDSATRVDSKTTLKGPKRKHNLKDIVYQRRREKSMTELMGETMYYLDGEFDSLEEDDDLLTSPASGTKRKAPGFGDFTSEPTTKTISVAKVSHTASSNPQQSFKVGECIRRVASQLTGSPSILKGSSDGGNNECLGEGDEDVLETSNDSDTEMSLSPSQQSTVDEMLSQLHLSAQDPMKGYSFLAGIVSFFAEFRNFAVSSRRQQMRKGSGRKRKSSAPLAGPPESFEFDDRNDSYWTDMVVQNSAVAKPARRGRKRKDEQDVPADSDKPPQAKPRKSSRKQYFHGPLGSGVETPLGDEEQKKQLPTELMLNFTGMGSLPTAMNLNKMFRCFGPLKESETEIDTQNSRARVVFKKRSDAEVAYSSAAMFNIFGSTLVNYQLNYEPSVSFKTSNLALTDDQVKAT